MGTNFSFYNIVKASFEDLSVIFRMVKISRKISLLMVPSGRGACDTDTDSRAVIPADRAVTVAEQDDQSEQYNTPLIAADAPGYHRYEFSVNRS